MSKETTEMKILYTDVIPCNLISGIVFFTLRERVMSVIKSKIWKTFSHVGVVYKSSVSGTEKNWISYMDEIYGLVTCPLDRFIHSESMVSWAIRPLAEPQQAFSSVFRNCIVQHSSEDSSLYISEEGEISGSFDDELRTILGIPIEARDPGLNTNLGYVEDILTDTCRKLGMKTEKDRVLEFEDDREREEELMETLSPRVSEKEELLKTIHQLLGMVNLTTQTVRPPIQNLISQPHKILQDVLYQPSENFSVHVSGGLSNSIYPNLTDERRHAAEVISKMFASGLASEGVREVFEEELDTTVLARRGRAEMTRELLGDLLDILDRQLQHAKTLLDKKTLPNKSDRETYNQILQDMITAEGSLLAHLGLERKLGVRGLEI